LAPSVARPSAGTALPASYKKSLQSFAAAGFKQARAGPAGRERSATAGRAFGTPVGQPQAS